MLHVINLVCIPVTPDSTQLNCIQQASTSTQVSLSAFARGWHCVDQYMVLFRYYSLEGDTAMQNRLHDRLYHALLVFNKFIIFIGNVR